MERTCPRVQPHRPLVVPTCYSPGLEVPAFDVCNGAMVTYQIQRAAGLTASELSRRTGYQDGPQLPAITRLYLLAIWLVDGPIRVVGPGFIAR